MATTSRTSRAPPTERPIGFGRLKRKEDARFIRGQGTYLDDIKLPGMVHGAVLRSPYAHAKIVSIDTSAALAHPNVAAVVTAKDLETLGLAWMPTISYDTQAVLAGDKVRFQGQEVAFVIATDEYSANDALALIDVEYEPLPAVVNARKALDADAPLIRDDKSGQRDNLASPTWEAGDEEATDRAFAEADTVVTRDIIYPRCHPAPLETCGIIADFNPETGQLDIYNGNQAPHAHRTVYAHVAGLAEHMIRIRCQDIGGGFGNKVPVYPGYVCAIAGSIVAGVPVKWVENRTENLTSTGFARDYIMRSEICAKDGKITGLRVDVIADHGAFDSTAQPTKFPAGFFHIVCGSYDLEASHVKVKAVYTNKAPGGVAYRCSFRITEAVYLVERMVDALALEMKVDPIDLRMSSFIGARAVPVRDDDRLDLRLGQLRRDDEGRDGDRRLRRAAPRAGREARARRADGHRRVVLHRGRRRRPAQAHGHPRAVDERRRRPARAPVGQGGRVASAPRPRARATRRRSRRSSPRSSASRPRTSRSATATPTSRRTASAPTAAARRRCPAAAVAVVSRKVRDKARLIAATMLETRPEDLAWEKGRWYVKGDPEQGAMIEDIAARAYSGEAMPAGMEGGLDAQVIYDPPNLTYPYGAYIAVVDIDPDTAQVTVRRFIAVDDCGVRINPMIVDGQIHGGLAEGVGIALMELISLRRGGQLPELVVHGLPDPDRARVPGLRARRDRHAVPAPPARRQGRRRVAERRLAAGDRQRGDRRAARDPRRRPHRHALHAGPRVGGDAGAARAAAVMPAVAVAAGAGARRAGRAVRDGDGGAGAEARRASRPATSRSCSATARSRASSAASAPSTACARTRCRRSRAASRCCCGSCPFGADDRRREAERGRDARTARSPSRTRACRAARSSSSSSPCCRRRACWSWATRRSRRAAALGAELGLEHGRGVDGDGSSRAPATSRWSSPPTAATSSQALRARARGGAALRRPGGQPQARRRRARRAARRRASPRSCWPGSTCPPGSTSAPAPRRDRAVDPRADRRACAAAVRTGRATAPTPIAGRPTHARSTRSAA